MRFAREGRVTCKVPVNWISEALKPRENTAELQVSTLQIPKCTLKKKTKQKTLESCFSVTEGVLHAV